MKATLSHEFYKLIYQRVSWLAVIVLFGLMIYACIPFAYITRSLVTQGFGAGQWATIIMVVISANFVSMEFRNNTMPTLLYKSPSKLAVFWAKLLALILYGLFLLLVGLAFALLIKPAVLGGKFPWGLVYRGHTLLNAFLLNMVGVGIYLLFTITLSLWLISLVKSTATVIIIGLFIGFLGASVSAVVMQAIPGLVSAWAWNPFNMINIITQLSDASVIKLSHLTDGELILGNLIYALIFLLLGRWAFKKRRI